MKKLKLKPEFNDVLENEVKHKYPIIYAYIKYWLETNQNYFDISIVDAKTMLAYLTNTVSSFESFENLFED
jgi:hypothetical protein